jgi:HEAT repeats
MRHKKYESLVVLSYYDEISRDETEVLENHLKSCRRCRAFNEKLTGVLPDRKAWAGSVSEENIFEARAQFRKALFAESDGSSGRQRVARFSFQPRWRAIPVYTAALMAFAMLSAGVAVGYFLFAPGNIENNGLRGILSEISSKNSRNTAISDVRFVSTGDKSGEVEFSFDLIRRYEMRGSLDDGYVQKILAFALVNSDNPGVRLRTIGVLGSTVSVKPDGQIVNALVQAVKTDDNVGVRREALLSMMRFPFDNTTKDLLLYVLQHDKNPGMRVAAINFLSGKESNEGMRAVEGKGIDPRVLDVLKERSSSDQNKYVRLKAADMLKDFKEL